MGKFNPELTVALAKAELEHAHKTIQKDKANFSLLGEKLADAMSIQQLDRDFFFEPQYIEYDKLQKLCKDLDTLTIEKNVDENKRQLQFITINPSPDFLYNKISDMNNKEEQLEYTINVINHIKEVYDELPLAISVETGKKKNIILHYHLMYYTSKQGIVNIMNYLKNYYTSLHLMGYKQKAVKISQDYTNKYMGITYFHGMNKHIVYSKNEDPKNKTPVERQYKKPDAFLLYSFLL